MANKDWTQKLETFEQQLIDTVRAEGSSSRDLAIAEAKYCLVLDAIADEEAGELEPWFDLDQELCYIVEALEEARPYTMKAPVDVTSGFEYLD